VTIVHPEPSEVTATTYRAAVVDDCHSVFEP
jgi:hypothetical protein